MVTLSGFVQRGRHLDWLKAQSTETRARYQAGLAKRARDRVLRQVRRALISTPDRRRPTCRALRIGVRRRSIRRGRSRSSRHRSTTTARSSPGGGSDPGPQPHLRSRGVL